MLKCFSERRTWSLQKWGVGGGRGGDFFFEEPRVRVRSHSRFLRPVALVVDGCGDADHNGGEEVTGHVVVLLPGVLALKDLDQHEVQLDPLQAHPGEGRQEEEVEDSGDDGAADLEVRRSEGGEIMGSISIRWRAFIQINSAVKRIFKDKKRSVAAFVENCISYAGYFMTRRAAVIAGASQIHTYQPECGRKFMNIHPAAQAQIGYTFQLSISAFELKKYKKNPAFVISGFREFRKRIIHLPFSSLFVNQEKKTQRRRKTQVGEPLRGAEKGETKRSRRKMVWLPGSVMATADLRWEREKKKRAVKWMTWPLGNRY